MKLKSRIDRIRLMLALCVLFAIAICAAHTVFAQTIPAGEVGARPGVAITLCGLSQGEDLIRPLPVVVSFVNLGDTPLYVAAMEDITLHIVDDRGNPVGGKAVKDPGPPPRDWYMTREGRAVLMQPVWRLEPKAGVARMISDALADYPKPFPQGQYKLRAPLQTIKVFSEKDLVHRKDTKYELWVEAGAKGDTVPVVTNNISFKSGGPDKNR